MTTLNDLAARGFRILPIAGDGSKKPLVEGFGKDNPDFTVAPDNFRDGDLIGFLTGPCPALGEDWLAVLDLDGNTTLDQVNDYVGGEPLPETLSSKGYRHFYFRVPPSDLREAIRAWVRIFGRTEGAPECDLKWHGGYAIEKMDPAWWDDGFNASRIARLPAAWLQAVLAKRNANPYAGDTSPRVATSDRAPLTGDWEGLAVILGSVWPMPGHGCHEAALALGGILGDSWWSEDDIARFSCAVFLASGTKNRVPDVLHSVGTKRAGGECKGWPSLRACLKDCARGDYNAALKALKAGVPGLSAPKVVLPVDPTVAHANRQLVIGSNPEVAQCVIDEHLRDAIADEGQVWIQDQTTHLWGPVDPAQIQRWVIEWDGAQYFNPEGKRRDWKANSTPSVLRDMRNLLSHRNFFSGSVPGVPFANGFLEGKTGQLIPLAEARCRWCLPFDYSPGIARKSPPRRWIRFIQSIWGSDRQAINLVHEILGYLLSGRTDLQKIFLFIGPPRGGKGTVFRLIKRIFRDQAAAFKINRLENEFGLQSLLGRVVAYDQDVRAASGRMKSPGQVVERLLGISGEDEQTIPRKNLEDLILTLGVRLMLGTNPPFSLGDVTGALATRLVLLEFPTSFLGKEETDLDEALAAELPQIVDLALEALATLSVRGRFVEPDSSKEERAALERLTNPMLGFLEDRCVVAADATVPCSDLYRAAQAWRAEEGHKDMSSGTFAEFLRVRGIKKARPITGPKSARVAGPRSYIGIRLRTPADEGDPG